MEPLSQDQQPLLAEPATTVEPWSKRPWLILGTGRLSSFQRCGQCHYLLVGSGLVEKLNKGSVLLEREHSPVEMVEYFAVCSITAYPKALI